MNKFVKILILASSINLCCSDNIITKKNKALVLLNMHKDSLNNLKLNQNLCYLPDIIKNILIKHSSSDRFLNKKNNIFNLLSIKNEIEQILPILINQNQIDSLKNYYDKLNSGIFKVYLNRTCSCPAGLYEKTLYSPPENVRITLCCPLNYDLTISNYCIFVTTGYKNTVQGQPLICVTSIPTS